MELHYIKELLRIMLSNHTHGMLGVKEILTEGLYKTEIYIKVIYTEDTKKPITTQIVAVFEKIRMVDKVTDDILKEMYLELLQDIAIAGATANYILYLKLKS